jgi:hypothetical protein
MKRMERKRFLQAAGGSALAGIGFLYPGAAEARRAMLQRSGAAPASSPAMVEHAGPDPTYAEGEVVAKTSEGVVLQAPNVARAVRIPPGTIVWKEHEGSANLIELHDWVDVKGIPQTDGSLLATSGMVFVNIGRTQGVIEEITGASLTISGPNGRATLELSSRLEVIRSADESAYSNGVRDLAIGTPIGAVGLLLPKGGFRATRIWT